MFGKRMRFKSLVETFQPTKFKKGVRHKMNIKTITLNIYVLIELVYNNINPWVQEDSGFGLWITMRFNSNQDRYPKRFALV